MSKISGRAFKGAAIAAVAALGFAGQALAGSTPVEANPTSKYIGLITASMNTGWTANVGTSSSNMVTAYSSGVTFDYVNLNNSGQVITQAGTVVTTGAQHTPLTITGLSLSTAESATQVYSLYGFCVDITHDITINNQLDYTYVDSYTPVTGPVGNPLPTDFHGNNLSAAQLPALTKLIDTGYLLHEKDVTNSNANIQLQLAAIQAAIWKVETGTVVLNQNGSWNLTGGFVTLNNASGTAGQNTGGAIAGTGSYTYQQYFNSYSTGAFTDLGDKNDTFYTIIESKPSYDGNQSFAIGWPIAGVPEPATWGLMLVGFGGLGSLLRRRRTLSAA